MRPVYTILDAIAVLERTPAVNLAPPGSTVGPEGECCPVLYLARAWDRDFARSTPLSGPPLTVSRALDRARSILGRALGLPNEEIGVLIRAYDWDASGGCTHVKVGSEGRGRPRALPHGRDPSASAGVSGPGATPQPHACRVHAGSMAQASYENQGGTSAACSRSAGR